MFAALKACSWSQFASKPDSSFILRCVFSLVDGSGDTSGNILEMSKKVLLCLSSSVCVVGIKVVVM